MADKLHLLCYVLETVVVLLCVYCDCRPLDGYAFPVYTTEVCPRNLTEWQERSLTLNCTKRNAYMCVPNENITELLEFCYSGPQIRIVKGLCMFLFKHHSILDDYECSNFTEGCPSTNYRSQDVNIYQSCVAIANGCFLADPSCNRVTTMHYLTNRTSTTYYHGKTDISQHERVDWIWKVALSGVMVVLFIAVCIFSLIIFIKSQGSENPFKIEEVALSEFVEEAPVQNVSGRHKTENFEKNEDILFMAEHVEQAEKTKNQLNKSNKVSEIRLTRSKTNDNEGNEILQKSVALSPLRSACEKGQDTLVKYLLDRGAKINVFDTDGFNPLSIACYKGYENTVQLLLDNGADINLCNNSGASPLYIACHVGHDGTVQLLLNNGADINLCENNGDSPLCVASFNGHYGTVQLLLTNGANINLGGNNEDSPLYTACLNGHHSIVQLLLNNGADINICNKYGATPLYIACQNGHDSVVQLLLNNGAHINLCAKTGASPLYIACQTGHDSTVKLLLNKGAHINLCDDSKASPLYIACLKGHDSTVQLLLNNGADINLCSADGVSPLTVAIINDFTNIVQLLTNNGAEVNIL